jgi:hypothetical protein
VPTVSNTRKKTSSPVAVGSDDVLSTVKGPLRNRKALPCLGFPTALAGAPVHLLQDSAVQPKLLSFYYGVSMEPKAFTVG